MAFRQAPSLHPPRGTLPCINESAWRGVAWCGARQVVDAFFARNPGLAHYHRPMAGPICYPCFRGEGLTAADVMVYARTLVAATGVLVLPGGACYDVDEPKGGGAHFRVGLGRLDIKANLAVYEQALQEDTRFRRCEHQRN